MAKYSIDDTTMTGLANSARALTGGTAGLTPSGIKSVMDTEKLNVDAALAAIAEKGVSVPSGSKSDELAELIAAIEAGGGDAGSETKMTAGKFTPASNLTEYKIEHNLGAIPDIFILHTDYSFSKTDNRFMSGIYYKRYTYIGSVEHHHESFKIGLNGATSVTSGDYDITSETAEPNNKAIFIYGATENDVIFSNLAANTGVTNTFLKAGVPTCWIAIKTDFIFPYK